MGLKGLNYRFSLLKKILNISLTEETSATGFELFSYRIIYQSY